MCITLCINTYTLAQNGWHDDNPFKRRKDKEREKKTENKIKSKYDTFHVGRGK